MKRETVFIVRLSEGGPEALAEVFNSGDWDTGSISITRVRPTKVAFVIMKFGDKVLDSAYEGVYEPVLYEFGYSAIRVDHVQDSGPIPGQIHEIIRTADLVLADLSGERPNCYYEAGLAHALEKKMILTIREEDRIHFDLSHYRFIVWDTESALRRKLRRRLEHMDKSD